MQSSDPQDCEKELKNPKNPRDQANTLTIIDKTEDAFPQDSYLNIDQNGKAM